jgi:hypothetical protein
VENTAVTGRALTVGGGWDVTDVPGTCLLTDAEPGARGSGVPAAARQAVPGPFAGPFTPRQAVPGPFTPRQAVPGPFTPRQAVPAGQPVAVTNNQYMTCVAVAGGGAPGSYPAWEPV